MTARQLKLTKKKDSLWWLVIQDVSKETLLQTKLPSVPEILAMGWQHEFAPTTGHEHLQAWALVRRGVDARACFKSILGDTFGKSAPCRGTIKESINYCTKPGDDGKNYDPCFYPIVWRTEGICFNDMHPEPYLKFSIVGDDGLENVEYRIDDEFIAECQAEYAESKRPDARCAVAGEIFKYVTKKRKDKDD